MTEQKQKKGRPLVGIAIGIAILVIPSMVAFQWLTRSHPVYKAGVRLIQEDAVARQMLGAPIDQSWWVYGRSVRKAAEFRIDFSGPRGEAEAIISAKKEQGAWQIRYIWLKPKAGRIQPLPSAKGFPVE